MYRTNYVQETNQFSLLSKQLVQMKSFKMLLIVLNNPMSRHACIKC